MNKVKLKKKEIFGLLDYHVHDDLALHVWRNTHGLIVTNLLSNKSIFYIQVIGV